MAPATYDDVLRAVRQLQPAEQQRLMEALYEELEDHEDVRDGAAALAAIAAGEEEVIPFDVAMAELGARASKVE